MENSGLKETVVLAVNGQGEEIRAVPVRLDRYLTVFEVPREGQPLQVSEVLTDLRIIVRDRMLYVGRGVVRNLIDTGAVLVCEVALEDSWVESGLLACGSDRARLIDEFGDFFRHWQSLYRVRPEYKIVAADMHTFLTDFRLWVDQAEVGVRSMPAGDRARSEREMAAAIADASLPDMNGLFERFETIAAGIEPDLRPVHEVYIRRQIHPLVLCSPFAFRSVSKPLGYAGDYEIVNMMLRDPYEGGSLFAKVLNRWFVEQPPALAHRNRIDALVRSLEEETLRLHQQGRRCRIFNVGCGPAGEIQRFLAESDLSHHTKLHLVDFNEETIAYTRGTLEALVRQHQRQTEIEFTRKSVVQLLKGRSRTVIGTDAHQYDLIHCAGLFDYLPSHVCRQLLGLLHDLVSPGGRLIVTNVDPSDPRRHWLGHILDWHLIYRTAADMLALCPPRVRQEDIRVTADATGVNIFLEIRRPAS